MSIPESMQKIGTIDGQSLYVDNTNSKHVQYAVLDSSQITGGPRSISKADGEQFLKRLGVSLKCLDHIGSTHLLAATDALEKARRHITGQVKRNKEPDRELVEMYTEDARVAFDNACGEVDPTAQAALANLQSSLDVVAYANKTEPKDN